VMFDLPTLAIVAGSSAVGSIHPSIIGSPLLVFSSMLGHGHTKKKLLTLGLIYILFMFLSSLAFGMLIMLGLNYLPQKFSTYLPAFVTIIVVAGGIIEIKDFYWYGKGVSIKTPKYLLNAIHKTASKKTSVKTSMYLGLLTTLAVLICSGLPYIGVLAMLHNNNIENWKLLVIFNLIYILPLLFIMLKIHSGLKISRIIKWKEHSKKYARLVVGILLIVHGWILILIANGEIYFG